MSFSSSDIALILLGYLSGSVPYGLLLARRARGIDVRSAGSGNIGAANVARVAGAKIAIATLVLDALKGVLPVLLAKRFETTLPAELLPSLVGGAAFLGHIYPVWLKFKGGKGVATALGVLLAVMPPVIPCAAFALFAAVFAVGRVSSVASLSAATASVVIGFVHPIAPGQRVLLVLLWAMLFWTHRSNIGRLLRRQENRV